MSREYGPVRVEAEGSYPDADTLIARIEQWDRRLAAISGHAATVYLQLRQAFGLDDGLDDGRDGVVTEALMDVRRMVGVAAGLLERVAQRLDELVDQE